MIDSSPLDQPGSPTSSTKFVMQQQGQSFPQQPHPLPKSSTSHPSNRQSTVCICCTCIYYTRQRRVEDDSVAQSQDLSKARVWLFPHL